MIFDIFKRAPFSAAIAAAALGACMSDRVRPVGAALPVPTHSELSIVNAELEGSLYQEGPCLRLRQTGGTAYTPIWPAGTILSNGRIRLPEGQPTNGATAPLGARVRLLGTRELPPSAVRPAECGSNFFAVVQLKQ